MIKINIVSNIIPTVVITGFVLLVLLNSSAYTQEYKVLNFSSKQGLHNNLTKAIAQDSLGFIWVATDNGLERFNGLDFELYNRDLPSNYVKSFLKTHEGCLLAVTDLGIVKIECKPDTAKFIPIIRGSTKYTDSLLFYPKLIYEDQSLNYWIADNNSIWLFKDEKLKKYTFGKKNYTINFQRSFAITENRFGDLYVFSETGYTYLYDKQRDKFTEQLNIPKFPSVDGAQFVDDSRILIASYDGVFLLNIGGEKPKIKKILNTDACQVEQLNDSTYYVANWTAGVYKCIIKNDKIKIEKVAGVQSNKLNNIFIDKKNNLWLSTDFGIILAQNQPFSSMSQLLNKIFVQSIDIAPNDQVYCIAGNAYSVVKNNNALETNLIFSLSQSGNLSQIAVSKSDPSLLYIATTNAQLYEFKNNKLRRTIDLSTYGRVLFFLSCDYNNNIWACLDGCDGVLKISPDFDIEVISKSQGLESRGIVIRYDDDKNLYCGGIGDSSYLFKYDYESKIFINKSVELPFTHNNNLVVNDITFQNKQIFLATTEGVLQKNEENIQRIDLGDYTIRNVSCIANDKNNYIWFSNENGLFKYKSGKYYVFSENDGLNTHVGSYRCLAIDSTNQIWFGTQTGLNYSKGENPITITEKPILTSIEIDGVPASIHSTNLKIKKHSYIQFKYITLELPGNEIIYKTLLGGFQNEWSNEQNENKLILPNLPVGDYTLFVKARQHGNYDWSSYLSYSFSVVPSWYQTWWAYLIYILLFILSFILVNKTYHKRLIHQKRKLELKVKIRTDELISKNKELQLLNTTKDKFFSIIAHDLKNPFSSILGITKILVSNFDALEKEKKRELINVIYSASENTYSLLENLLDWGRTQTNAIKFKPELINISELVNEAVEISTVAIHSKNLQLINRVEPNIQINVDRNMITTVIRNLLVNAIKYSYKGQSITIKSYKEQEYLKISIIDEGIGISEKRMSELFKITEKTSEPGTEKEKGTGLGLILCKEFVEKHGGIIDVKSTQGQGSTFWFQIPF